MACCSCGVIVSCWPIFRTSDGFMAEDFEPCMPAQPRLFRHAAPRAPMKANYMPADEAFA